MIYIVPSAKACVDNDLRRSVDKTRIRFPNSFLKIDFLQSFYPKMVFTVNKTIDFYEDNYQMYIPQATRLQLVNEGLEHVHEHLEVRWRVNQGGCR